MNTDLKVPANKQGGSDDDSAEIRLQRLGIDLPEPPEPFGFYAESVQTGNLLFLTGMLPTAGRGAKFVGQFGAQLTLEEARDATRLAALNALAVARQHLGTLDKVTRIVRLGVSIATSGDVANTRRLLMQRRICCRMYSEKKRTRLAWCTGLQVFR